MLSLARELLPASVKCIAFVPGSAHLALVNFGPEKYGGFGDFEAKTVAEMAKTGKELFPASSKVIRCSICAEILSSTEYQVYYDYNGTIIDIPGIPPFYDYEKSPQITGNEPYPFVHMQCHK